MTVRPSWPSTAGRAWATSTWTWWSRSSPSRYRVATFQQRGLAPSTEQGDFTVAEAVADLVAVLDDLGWATAYLMGHSWGGHLALHAAAAIPERIAGVLSVDPLGGVGDGGAAAFGAELVARLPEPQRRRIAELDEKEAAGLLTLEDALEALGILWPSYFADAQAAPPMPAVRMSMAAGEGTLGRPRAPAPGARGVPVLDRRPGGSARGRAQPDAAECRHRDRRAHPRWLVPRGAGVGHFVWLESPGCVLEAMDRLVVGPR